MLPDVEWSGTMAIIGGGAAGMYAAKLLHDKGLNYKIYEAGSNLGGRIKPFSGFGGNVELGAEFIHGNKSDFYNLVKNQGFNIVNENSLDLSDQYYINNQLYWEGDISDWFEIRNIESFEEVIENYSGDEIAVQNYVNQFPTSYPFHTRHILNRFYGNEYGTSLSRLGMRSLSKEISQWSSGNNNYFVSDSSILNVFEIGYSSALSESKVVLNWPVATIDYSGEKVVLTSQTGEVAEVNRVILTVPLTVLQAEDINFIPALPTTKITAISKIGMGAGMKIIMQFIERFWDEKMGAVVNDGYVPEWWTPLGTTNILTAFIMGENAEFMSAQNDDAINIAADELDRIFGVGVATSRLTDAHIEDWGKNPFVKGAYSFARPNSSGQRGVLALPVDNKIYFAGEATNNQGHNSTVHGAMETGFRAVKEFIDSVV